MLKFGTFVLFTLLGSKIRSSTSVYFSGFLKKLFCRGGRLVECATKDLAFVSVTGFLLALTIYYFQISFDLPNRAVLSNVGELCYRHPFGNVQVKGYFIHTVGSQLS